MRFIVHHPSTDARIKRIAATGTVVGLLAASFAAPASAMHARHHQSGVVPAMHAR